MCVGDRGRSASGRGSEPEIAETGVAVGPPAEWPMEFALDRRERQIVDGAKPKLHEAALIELPVFISVRAEPVAGIVMPFVGEANGDAIVAESPHLLDETVVKLAGPFAGEERHNRLAPLKELGAISPA